MALNTLDILIAEAVNLQQTMVADMEEPEELREAVDLVGPLADWDRAKAALQLPKDLRRRKAPARVWALLHSVQRGAQNVRWACDALEAGSLLRRLLDVCLLVGMSPPTYARLTLWVDAQLKAAEALKHAGELLGIEYDPVD